MNHAGAYYQWKELLLLLNYRSGVYTSAIGCFGACSVFKTLSITGTIALTFFGLGSGGFVVADAILVGINIGRFFFSVLTLAVAVAISASATVAVAFCTDQGDGGY